MKTRFEQYYDENAKRNTKKAKGCEDAPGKKFFIEGKMSVIELKLNLCGYSVIVTSEKMTAKKALEVYKGRDSSEKLFLSDKTFLGRERKIRTIARRSISIEENIKTQKEVMRFLSLKEVDDV